MGNIPSSVRELVGVIGLRHTLELSDQVRFREVYVPAKRLSHDHVLVRVLGQSEASAVQREFGGCKLYLPKMRKVRTSMRRAAIVQAYRDGQSIEDIARAMGVRAHTVTMTIKRAERRTTPPIGSFLDGPMRV